MNYPIHHISVKPYHGRDPKKQMKYHAKLQLAEKIKLFLNSEMKQFENGEIRSYDYGEIAAALFVDSRQIYDILFANGGGSNGITVGKP